MQEILARPKPFKAGVDECNFDYSDPNLPVIIVAVSSSNREDLAHGHFYKHRPHYHLNGGSIVTDEDLLQNASYGVSLPDPFFDFRFTTVEQAQLPPRWDAKYLVPIVAVRMLLGSLAMSHGLPISDLEAIVDGKNRHIQNGKPEPDNISLVTCREIAHAYHLPEGQWPRIRFKCLADEERRLANKADRIAYMLFSAAKSNGLQPVMQRHAAKYVPLNHADLTAVFDRYSVIHDRRRAGA